MWNEFKIASVIEKNKCLQIKPRKVNEMKPNMTSMNIKKNQKTV